MHTLKSYYWVVKPERENGVCLKGLDINRPSEADIVTIRFEYQIIVSAKCQSVILRDLPIDAFSPSKADTQPFCVLEIGVCSHIEVQFV